MLHSILKHLVPINKSIANNIMCLISKYTHVAKSQTKQKHSGECDIHLNNSSLQRENWVTYIFILNLLCFE